MKLYSFGLSDLHGDNRVHNTKNGPDGPSGFGFELTFRLLKDSSETSPPTWPARLMQSLAKYVFKTGIVKRTPHVHLLSLFLNCLFKNVGHRLHIILLL